VDTVRHLSGVKGISDLVRLKTEPRSNEIKLDIEAALDRHYDADDQTISVSVHAASHDSRSPESAIAVLARSASSRAATSASLIARRSVMSRTAAATKVLFPSWKGASLIPAGNYT
jgi:hypothetical protein